MLYLPPHFSIIYVVSTLTGQMAFKALVLTHARKAINDAIN